MGEELDRRRGSKQGSSPIRPTTWSGPSASGVIFAVVQSAHQVSTAFPAASRPDLDRVELSSSELSVGY